MSSEWLPIRYRDFWDLPRAFAVDYLGETYFFDCLFDAELDDYPPEYSVYLADEAAKRQIETNDWSNVTDRLSKVGRLVLTWEMFDPTKRLSIRSDAVASALAS